MAIGEFQFRIAKASSEIAVKLCAAEKFAAGVIGADASEIWPVPKAVSAATVTMYSSPLVRPSMAQFTWPCARTIGLPEESSSGVLSSGKHA